jgi:hypothetical protein
MRVVLGMAVGFGDESKDVWKGGRAKEEISERRPDWEGSTSLQAYVCYILHSCIYVCINKSINK